MKVESYEDRATTEYVKEIIFQYDYRYKENNYVGLKEPSSGKSFGAEKTFFSPFTTDDEGADEISKLIMNRFKHQDRMLMCTAGQDAYALALHDVVTVSHNFLGITNQLFEIIDITYRAKDVSLVLGAYSLNLFDVS